jgi:hypothetical protein
MDGAGLVGTVSSVTDDVLWIDPLRDGKSTRRENAEEAFRPRGGITRAAATRLESRHADRPNECRSAVRRCVGIFPLLSKPTRHTLLALGSARNPARAPLSFPAFNASEILGTYTTGTGARQHFPCKIILDLPTNSDGNRDFSKATGKIRGNDCWTSANGAQGQHCRALWAGPQSGRRVFAPVVRRNLLAPHGLRRSCPVSVLQSLEIRCYSIRSLPAVHRMPFRIGQAGNGHLGFSARFAVATVETRLRAVGELGDAERFGPCLLLAGNGQWPRDLPRRKSCLARGLPPVRILRVTIHREPHGILAPLPQALPTRGTQSAPLIEIEACIATPPRRRLLCTTNCRRPTDDLPVSQCRQIVRPILACGNRHLLPPQTVIQGWST